MRTGSSNHPKKNMPVSEVHVRILIRLFQDAIFVLVLKQWRSFVKIIKIVSGNILYPVLLEEYLRIKNAATCLDMSF